MGTPPTETDGTCGTCLLPRVQCKFDGEHFLDCSPAGRGKTQRITAGDDLLNNTPFRRLCLATIECEQITWNEIADRMKRDAGTVQWALGVRSRQRRIDYSFAVATVRACCAYPVDYGV